MKIVVDENEILNLNATQRKVIMHDIPEEIFEEDMCRRLNYIIMHKYEQCMKRLKNEWCESHDGQPCKLAQNGVKSIPTDDEMLAELIFAQPQYRSRSQRDATREAEP